MHILKNALYKLEQGHNISMNNMKNKSLANCFITFNMPEIIKAIKTGVKYMYVENMFVNNEEVSLFDLSRLNNDRFRYQVKTAIANLIMKYANANCLELERYISRMSTKEMKRKFNYSEINNFYLKEVSDYIYPLTIKITKK